MFKFSWVLLRIKRNTLIFLFWLQLQGYLGRRLQVVCAVCPRFETIHEALMCLKLQSDLGSNELYSTYAPMICQGIILLMEEILHHPGCINPDKIDISWWIGCVPSTIWHFKLYFKSSMVKFISFGFGTQTHNWPTQIFKSLPLPPPPKKKQQQQKTTSSVNSFRS